MFPYGIQNNPLWKTAARAGLKRISKMIAGGNIAGASALAKTPGVLKSSPSGSFIKSLGKGSEGVADLVAHPEHGVAVRKLFDPKGIGTQQLIQRKEQAGKAVDNPYVAKFMGSAPTPQGGGTMHFNEFVNSKGPIAAPAAGSPEEAAALRKTQNQTQMAMRGAGFNQAKDVRKSNMAWDANSGNFKTIDYVPAQKGEFFNVQGGNRYMMDRASKQVLRPEQLPRGLKDKNSLMAPAPSGNADQLFNQSYYGTGTKDLRKKMLGPGSGVHPQRVPAQQAPAQSVLPAPAPRPSQGAATAQLPPAPAPRPSQAAATAKLPPPPAPRPSQSAATAKLPPSALPRSVPPRPDSSLMVVPAGQL